MSQLSAGFLCAMSTLFRREFLARTQVQNSESARAESALAAFISRFSYPGIAFSLLPVFVSLMLLGVQPGNRTYGPSHWFVTYEHGFLRRALIGHLFSRVHFLSLHAIVVVEAVVFLLALLLTVLVLRPLLFGSLADRRFAAFLLAAPAFLPHMAYMDGEMDNFLYIALLIGAFALARLGNVLGLIFATASTIIGLLIHEAFAMMFYPLVLVLAVDLVSRRRLKYGWVVAHLAMVAAAFLCVIHFGKLSVAPGPWIAAAQQRTDMRIDKIVFQVLDSSLLQQLRFVFHLYRPKLIVTVLVTFALAIPYGIVLVRWLRTAFAVRQYSRSQIRWMLFIFAAPLSLSVVGHDIMRWVSALCINVSLYLLFLYGSDQSDSSSAKLREALSAWTEGPAYAATLVYLLAVGPWGFSGNLLIANLAHVFGR
jgi:hypothetical protein